MKKLTNYFYILLFILLSVPIKGQEIPKIPINTVVERLQKYLGVYPVEKMHLHFDKPYYAVGDTLWFKMYLHHNQIEYLPSKIGYVDVINGRDSLIQTLRIPLNANAGAGYFVLDPQVIKQDNYRFRAYTKWMMNFDMGYYYNKVVSVGDAINKKLGTEVSYATEGNKTKATVQFRDSKGGLLNKRKLTWEAIDGWDPFDKGKGETDDMGRAIITFSSKEKELLKNGRLIVKVEGETPLVGDFPLKNALIDADIQFFPEGGELLANVNKKVAFKAIGADGKGLSVKGKIIDSKKNTVVQIQDFGLGMGYFDLKPVMNETYKAVFTLGNGLEKTVDLPVVKSEGVNVVVSEVAPSGIQIGIVTSDEYFSKVQNQGYYIFGQMNGHLVYGAQATLKSSTINLNVSTENFPSGVIQFTLISPQGKVLSERLAFYDNELYLNIDVKSDKSKYAKKEKVVLDLLNTSINKSLSTLSVSVIDETKVPFDDQQESTIVNNILLTSDLKGYVEKPNYYFDPTVANRKDALDALLLTQGFRKFEYEDLIKEKYPQVEFLPEQGISLSGTLRLNTGKLYPNGGLLLSIPSAAVRKDVYTDIHGKFSFDNLNFSDSSKVVINARSNDNFRNIVINMDQTKYPAVDLNNPYKANEVLNIDQQLVSYLANSRNEYRSSILLDEIVVTATRKEVRTSKEFSALSGLSMADHRVDGDRLNGCNSLPMCLSTVLTGVTYDSQLLKYFLTRSYNQGARVPVQFFLNGMPIDEPSLASIIPSEIEAIEIFTRDDLGTVSRTYNNNGVVSIIMKKEKPKGPRMSLAQIEALLPKSNVLDLYPLGYIKERKYYVPKYDTEQSKAKNDYRTTIYWNPNVTLDEQGKAVLDFYNADGIGKYKVVVEGMDSEGKVGRTIYYYEVN